MKALLVHPVFPRTYWGFQYSLPFTGKRAALPPLGLVTVAAWLPESWELRLVDMNVQPLRDQDLAWADVVLVGGMLIQAPSMHQVLARARRAGKRTVVGGPAATTSHQDFPDADLVFRGEVEGRAESLVSAIEDPSSNRRVLAQSGGLPDLSATRVPRFDLLQIDRYNSMSVQYSRGCPYSCEFCDVIEIFGRVPRVKPPAQVLAELTALHDLGYRGTLFFVDDNFIGNVREVKVLLPELVRWQRQRGRPLELYTEASVNLSRDAGLMMDMVAAGFTAVFVGIETPSTEALREAGKSQNLKVDLREAVDALTGAGLEVMGGFIVGFDCDGPEVFAAQRRFLADAPIPLAMVGLLTALPGTALWRRLDREGRLRSRSSGDQFSRPNYQPRLDEEQLLSGYRDLLAALYSPEEYLRRCLAYLRRAPSPRAARIRPGGTAILLRAALRIGLLGRRRRQFWSLLIRALWRSPRNVSWAVAHAVQGEHLIRYTREDVLPRIERAIEEVRSEVRSPGRRAAN